VTSRRRCSRSSATSFAPSGIFVSDDPGRVDAENVLFYNLDARSFVHAPQCVRFERSWTAAPAPPTSLSVPARYYHRYEPVAAAEGFRSWRMTDDALAEWTDIPCTKIAGERAGWHIWHGMRAADSAITTDAGTARTRDFGLTATARVPANVHATAIGAVKGVIDGAIASFQRFPHNSQSPPGADAQVGSGFWHPSGSALEPPASIQERACRG
jgi:hypothetical protein